MYPVPEKCLTGTLDNLGRTFTIEESTEKPLGIIP
jgi:hypothetical protein